jgi:hypothetical protein
MLEYDVPSNGTRRRSYGGGFPREMHEGQQAGRRGGKIEGDNYGEASRKEELWSEGGS